MMLDLTSLASSRICHDLASPLGAVSNGFELLAMNTDRSEEMEMIEAALGGALARLSIYRIAFGAAQPDQMIAGSRIAREVCQLNDGGRHVFSWDVAEDIRRLDARVVLLGLLCLEHSTPLGGEISVDGTFTIRAHGRRIDGHNKLWQAVLNNEVPADLAGNTVQYGLLTQALRASGRKAELNVTEDELTLSL